jgi:hypothetical protein
VWEVASGLLEDRPEPVIYPRGSWGPRQAASLAGEKGWILGQ